MPSTKGFTTVELMMVIVFFAVALGLVTVPLTNLQGKTALADGTLALKDTIRRAETQALSGYLADGWGVHLSDTEACEVPATSYALFKGSVYDSASETTEVFDLPAGAEIADVSVGGGCDIMFSRYHGTTANAGTISLRNIADGATTTVTINAYGRITE